MRTITLALAAALLAACSTSSPPSLTSRMDDADRQRLDAAHHYAFHGTLAQQAVWANARTGLGGTVRSLRESCESGASDCDPETSRCRDFEEDTSSTDGTMQRRAGRACLRTDGTLAIDFDPARRF